MAKGLGKKQIIDGLKGLIGPSAGKAAGDKGKGDGLGKTFKDTFSKFNSNLSDNFKDLMEKTTKKPVAAPAAASGGGDRKQFRKTVNSVIVEFGSGALKQLESIIGAGKGPKKEGPDVDTLPKKQPSWWRKLLGPALLILGGLAAFVYGLITDGPLKGLFKLLAKGGILGGLKWLGKIISKQIGLLKAGIKSFFKLTGLTKFFRLIRMKLKRTFRPILSFFTKTIPNFFKKMFSPVTKMFKATKGGFLKAIFGFIAKWGGKALKLLKPIPVLGSLISLAFAYSRFKSNDITGGILEIASGIASLFPGIGTVISIGIDILLAVLDYKAGGTPKGGGKGKGGILLEWGKKLFGFVLKIPPFSSVVHMYHGITSLIDGQWKKAGMHFIYSIPIIGNVLEWFLGPAEEPEQAAAVEGSKGSFLSKIGNWILGIFPFKNIVQFGKGIGQLVNGEFFAGLTNMAYAVPFFGSLVSWLGGPGSAEEAQKEKSDGGKGFFSSFKNRTLRKVLGWLPETIMGFSIRGRVARWLGVDLSKPVKDEQEKPVQESIDKGSKAISEAGKKIEQASTKFGKSSPGVWIYLQKASKSLTGSVKRIASATRMLVYQLFRSSISLSGVGKGIKGASDRFRKISSGIYTYLHKASSDLAFKAKGIVSASRLLFNAVRAGLEKAAEAVRKQFGEKTLAEKAAGTIKGLFKGEYLRKMLGADKSKTPVVSENWIRGYEQQMLIKSTDDQKPLRVKVVEPIQIKEQDTEKTTGVEGLINLSRDMNEKLFPSLLTELREGAIITKLDEINESVKANKPMPFLGGGGGGAGNVNDMRRAHQPLIVH